VHCATVVAVERTIGVPMALRLLGRGNKIALPREVPWPYESLKSKGTPAEMAGPQGEGSRLG
jgi:hypothetical protein